MLVELISSLMTTFCLWGGDVVAGKGVLLVEDLC